jgi:hypothetical protein
MKEIWKAIPNTPNRFVSNLGRVRKDLPLQKPYYFSLSKNRGGSLRLGITYKGRTEAYVVARLVGDAFCKDYRPHLRAVYRDGDRSNCNAKNLKWVPQSQVTGVPYSRKDNAKR